MQFGLLLPTDRVADGEEFVSPEAIAEMARAAEEAGFDSCTVTDHPFPVQRWLDGGGHHALDPFVALSFAAAATSRIRLQTHILVLGYRNPFLTAKAALSLDILSRGRLTLGVGSGYLRGEFEALGADFENRGVVADETIVAMKRAFTEDAVAQRGTHFEARGPPIWVGGNSRAAIRRAVDHGEGWLPFPNTKEMSPFTRSPALTSLADLESRIAWATRYAEKVGRTTPLAVGYSLDGMSAAETTAADSIARVRNLEGIGVSWVGTGFPAREREAFCQAVRAFGRDVIEVSRAG